MKKCKDLVDDFRECSSRKKQVSCLYVGSVRSAEYIDCSSKLICLHLIYRVFQKELYNFESV
jgi:hypothetical protein